MSGCRPAAAMPTAANGGTCRPIWPAPGAPSTHRNVCFGHSDALLLPVHDLVAGARHSVDIAALQPVPDTRFLAALRAGLAVLAASGRPIAVRLLVGQYPPDGADAAALLSSLTSGLRGTPGAHSPSVWPPCAPAPPPRRAGVSPGRTPSSS